MKTKHKSLISFISPVLGLVLLGLWAYKTTESFDAMGYLIFGLGVFLIGFGLYFKIRSFKSEKAGLTSEDELSKRIKEKAAANAFSYSIYMWVFVILFLVDIEPKDKIIIGLGLMGMVLIFFLNWLYYSKVGISDENKN
ncbi:MAG: hypothetical protein WBM77_09565 [Maribacter sp.]